jgi:hypothetical protein
MTDPRTPTSTETALAVASNLATPVYQDLLQPGMRQVGQALEQTLGAVRVLLRPLDSLNRAGSILFDRIDAELRELLEKHPESEMVEPKAYIIGNAVSSMCSAMDEKPLRDMYRNLLAASLLKNMSSSVHPSFAEVIRQLTPHEALLFASVKQDMPILRRRLDPNAPDVVGFIPHGYIVDWQDHTEISVTELDNFMRLGLLRLDFSRNFSDKRYYEKILKEYQESCVKEAEEMIKQKRKQHVEEGILEMTAYGKTFAQVCVSTDTWTW